MFVVRGELSPTSFAGCELFTPDASVRRKSNRLNRVRAHEGVVQTCKSEGVHGLPVEDSADEDLGEAELHVVLGVVVLGIKRAEEGLALDLGAHGNGLPHGDGGGLREPFIFAEGWVIEWIFLSFPMLRCV